MTDAIVYVNPSNDRRVSGWEATTPCGREMHAALASVGFDSYAAITAKGVPLDTFKAFNREWTRLMYARTGIDPRVTTPANKLLRAPSGERVPHREKAAPPAWYARRDNSGQRAARVVQAYLNHERRDVIAAREGISYPRVSQILREAGVAEDGRFKALRRRAA